MSCIVNMSDLTSAPFYLKSGDPIMVAGRAMNANGLAAERSVAQGAVRMMTTGLDAPHLRIEGVPRERINLAWTDIPSASKYEVEWDQGKPWDANTPMVWTTYRKSIDAGGSDYTQLPTMSIDFKNGAHLGHLNSQNFRFRVRAIGGCGGDNPYSNILHVCLTDDPPIMPTVSTETVGCAVRINIGTAIGGAQAEAVKIQIQGSDYQYYTDNLPCSTAGQARECVVHQDVLKSHPYNLRPGHLVIVRVAGKNAAGWGAFSGPNIIGAYIAGIPYQLGAPVADDKTQDTISLSWPRYYGTGVDNNFDHDYELEWCEPLQNGAECDWAILAYTSGTTYTHTGLSAGLLYKYRVRATCVCEEAEFSEEVCVELEAPPAKPESACPTQLSQCRDFNLQWTRPAQPTEGVQAPNNYIVEVKSRSGTWEEYPCEIWGSMESCPLSTTVLMSPPFNLK